MSERQGPMRVLLIEPGASWSTADVSAGLLCGLEQHRREIDIVRYRLDQRIERSNSWLHYAWREAKKRNPAIEKPNVADVFYQGGIGALEMALRHQVDVVLVVSAMFLHPDVVMLMKRAGLRVAVLFTESPYDDAGELRMAKMVDGCWTSERSAVSTFRAVTPNVGYLRHAWHPERHTPAPQPGDEAVHAHDVVFVGSAWENRLEFLDAIDWTGIDLGLYGTWPSHLVGSRHPLRQYVRDQQVDNRVAAALYRRAKIGLNIYRLSKGWGLGSERIAQAESMNPRAYELAACGTFHVSTYRAEVPETFGDLVPTCRTPNEAGLLIREYLAHPERRQQMAAELPARVAGQSWNDRATTVLGDLQALIGLSPAYSERVS